MARYVFIGAGTTVNLGANKSKGDRVIRVIILPLSKASPGNVTLSDGGTNLVLFTGGISNLNDTKAFPIELGIESINTGGFTLTCGIDMTAIAIGDFSW